ncbi:Mu transposase domain-containing protein [Alkalicoccus luteus]|uniref:Mu transposase domain-containing protein n=1 Tax=Alkalicoccus luteus TaxID=1237094 RepID=UPI003CCDC203
MPETRYSLAEWRTAKVQPDYHIAVKGMFHSVPYDYIGYRVEVNVSEESVEIYFNHMRIASHPTLIGTYGQPPDGAGTYAGHALITAMNFYHVCHLIYHTVPVPLPLLAILFYQGNLISPTD